MSSPPLHADPLVDAINASRLRHPHVGDRWLIAVSGGPDSMALLRAAQTYSRLHHCEIACGHVDHQLRPESGSDSRWVEEQCRELGIPCQLERIELPFAQEQLTAIEEQARNARYAALVRMAQRTQATAIVTGHTADDNAETVLHHLFRGSGLRGLSGIPEVRSLASGVSLWRPLLSIRREEIVDSLARLQQPSLVDQSNTSAAFTRNRLRNELIPWLERELNPRSVEAVLRIAEQASDWQAWIETEAQRCLAAALIEPVTEVVRLRREVLTAAHPALLRECFVRLWVRLDWPRQSMTAEHWKRLAEVCQDDGPPAVHMPGGRDVRRRGAMVVIEP